MLITKAATLTIKFVAKGPAQQNHQVWLRQFPGSSGQWGRCQFVFDAEARNYDWLVVYDDLPCRDNQRFSLRREALACARANSVLITTEPATVKTYSAPFLAQFGHVVTSQEPAAIRHPRARFTQTALHWFYGIGKNSCIDYDRMVATPPPIKERLISTVCSSKQQKHTLHNLRYAFTVRLKQALPEMNHYGHGVKPMDDKAEALDPYRYHLAIENHIGLHHWTEKLADPFLAYCLPFYGGCPNAADYFPEESFIPIDLFDFEASLETIRRAIADNAYEKRLPAILEARRRVLNKYNLFAMLAELIESAHVETAAPRREGAIYSRRALRGRQPLRHLADHLLRRLRS